jgi:glycosyltransferase involved in cell wall biosynthesis
LDLLIRAFGRTVQSHPLARLVLVGDGPMRDQMIETAVNHNIVEKVIFTGMIPHEEVASLLQLADVAVLSPRVNEAALAQSPLKLFEYMAAGKAIVAPAMPNVAAIINDQENGLLVAPDSEAELAQALSRLLADGEMRQQLGQTAQAQALSRHSWETAVTAIEAILYDQIEVRRRSSMNRFTNGQAAPIVSVVVPAYNQAHYLPQTLDSIRAQTFADYEIVLVDDGSTDETPFVARRYAGRVRYIHQTNQGLAAARNTGIQAARGRYVALLDSDDAWEPDYLARMMVLAQQEPKTAVFYCGVTYIDENGRALPQPGSSRVVPPAQMYHTLLRANFLVPSTIFMRCEAALAVGLFDPDFRRLQDWELWLRLLRQGYQFQGIPDQLVRYRVHDSSLSTDASSGQQAAMALAVKHFGPDDGQWQRWPADKRRMFGGVYRYYALTASLIRGGDWSACARYLRRALRIDPSLVHDLDLFYELALGAQPMGQRGANAALNMAQRETDLRQLLTAIFTQRDAALVLLRRDTAVTAWYALALVAYNAQAYGYSRQFLRQLWQHKPLALAQRRVIMLWLRNVARQIKFLKNFRPKQTISLWLNQNQMTINADRKKQ